MARGKGAVVGAQGAAQDHGGPPAPRRPAPPVLHPAGAPAPGDGQLLRRRHGRVVARAAKERRVRGGAAHRAHLGTSRGVWRRRASAHARVPALVAGRRAHVLPAPGRGRPGGGCRACAEVGAAGSGRAGGDGQRGICDTPPVGGGIPGIGMPRAAPAGAPPAPAGARRPRAAAAARARPRGWSCARATKKRRNSASPCGTARVAPRSTLAPRACPTTPSTRTPGASSATSGATGPGKTGRAGASPPPASGHDGCCGIFPRYMRPRKTSHPASASASPSFLRACLTPPRTPVLFLPPRGT